MRLDACFRCDKDMLSHHARVFKNLLLYIIVLIQFFSWKPLWISTTLGRKSNSWTGEWGPGARAPSSTSFRGAESRQRAMTRRPPVLLLWRGINSVLNGVHPRSNSIPTGFHNVLVFNLVLLYTWEMLWWQKKILFLFYQTVLNN